jgi:rfaE bifunctional protein nucleotidyltransferase chain/domain
MFSRLKNKIIPYEGLDQWRRSLSGSEKPLVVTNGCFDLLHPGHIFVLEEARMRGNTLLVGVTSDESVRKLKGPTRPITPEANRAVLLAAMEAVSAVCVFPEVDACGFLLKSLPHLYVKGGDYTLDSINQLERRLLERLSVPIEILSRFECPSTSSFLADVVKRFGHPNRSDR